jgi:hypothetical protein
MGDVMEVRQTFSVTVVDRPTPVCFECGLAMATGDVVHLVVVSPPEGEHSELVHVECYAKVDA